MLNTASPMEAFGIGQQVAGVNPIAQAINGLVQRKQQLDTMQMSANQAGATAEQQIIGQARAYQNPDVQKVYGSSPFALPGQGGQPSQGGLVQTEFTRKTPFGEATYHDPAAEAQRNKIIAQQQATQPLSTEQLTQMTNQQITPVAGFHWMPDSSIQGQNAVKARTIAQGITDPVQKKRYLQSLVDSNSILPEQMNQILGVSGQPNQGVNPGQPSIEELMAEKRRRQGG